jgi:hypothetical protein
VVCGGGSGEGLTPPSLAAWQTLKRDVEHLRQLIDPIREHEAAVQDLEVAESSHEAQAEDR